MKIAVDVDGVLIDLMSEFLRIYNSRHDDKKTKEDCNSWNFFHDWEMNEEQTYEIFHQIIMNLIPEIEVNAHKYLKKLNKKYHVDIVTARRPQTRDELIEKLESMKIYKGKQYNDLIIIPYKPHDGKINFDYQIYIDDSPELAKTMKLYFKTKFLYLWDQPWNWKVEPFLNIKRVTNWKDIMGDIERCIKNLKEVYQMSG